MKDLVLRSLIPRSLEPFPVFYPLLQKFSRIVYFTFVSVRVLA
jgi:hypothetical protein